MVEIRGSLLSMKANLFIIVTESDFQFQGIFLYSSSFTLCHFLQSFIKHGKIKYLQTDFLCSITRSNPRSHFIALFFRSSISWYCLFTIVSPSFLLCIVKGSVDSHRRELEPTVWTHSDIYLDPTKSTSEMLSRSHSFSLNPL